MNGSLPKAKKGRLIKYKYFSILLNFSWFRSRANYLSKVLKIENKNLNSNF
ncbi:hypothetical protein AQPE_1007 [Aquipluma nitroreducens]|uniref:Uncharacterized protein n=1 Tax=Aquipluma nitroreducens TaxID=2010828 RepID=A0A5K7S5V1_9BACT|nr:hypothetical protein AQPE_1007 [Aquipluma nitroreducens]